MIIELALALLAQDWRVIDGDTVQIGEERIRLIDIDTPELRGADCDAERLLGQRAAERLAALLQGRDIVIERTGTDVYGRTLARLRVDGRDAGALLVAEGYAVEWSGRRHDWCAGQRRTQ
tara:strand:+ start:1468 stop:1827 length:360 start_codon:yes stop_codon:yes gene_type:complete